MSAVLIRLEGVLADSKPGEHLPGKQPHLDAKRLYVVLKEGFHVAVSTASNREHATFWLRSNGYGGVMSLYTDGSLADHVRACREVDEVAMVIAGPDDGPAALAEGLPVLAWARPLFGRRDFRPDTGSGFRAWDEIQAELDAQASMVPPEPDEDGRYER